MKEVLRAVTRANVMVLQKDRMLVALLAAKLAESLADLMVE